MRKSIIALMVVISVGLVIVAAVMSLSKDRVAPEIIVSDQDVTYEEGSGYDKLLDGVSAVDARDGDVSDTLLVEEIYPNDDGRTATVIYAARDKNNNIGKAKRSIKYKAENAKEEQETEESEKPKESKKSKESKESRESEPTAQSSEPEESSDEADESDEELPPENPRLTLSQEEITIEEGDSLETSELLGYVKEISDDEDSSDELYQRIRIDKDDLDTSVSGTYTLTYFVVDTDGNSSNRAELKVIVE